MSVDRMRGDKDKEKVLPKNQVQDASLGEKIQGMIDHLPEGGVTLAEIRDLVGQDGMLVLTAFLTLVFLVPVSIPGVSTVFGAAILLIGVCRLGGRNLWIPEKIARKSLPTEKLRGALRRGAQWLHSLERISRPHRMGWMVASGALSAVNNLALVAGALLLMAPFGLIPFSNTLPALALLLLSIGLLQRDGLCVICGHLMNVVTVIYFAVLILGGGVALHEIFRHFS